MPETRQPISLERILQTTQKGMQNLLDTLLKETSQLEKNNLDELQKITLEKIRLTEEIEENEQVRKKFLIQNSFNPNEPSEWLINNKLKSLWSEIKKTSQQAQKQNQINGVVINGNRHRTQIQFEILSATPPVSEQVYTASGENSKPSLSSTIAFA